MARSRVVVVATVLAATSALGWWFGEQRRAADTPYRVVQVLDGDTVVVRRTGGTDETIRILGVDTPETHHPTKPVQCYGPEAAVYTTRRLFGRVVRLEDDVERHDIYGRRLAYVYLDGRNFDRELLQRGYARLLVIEPNHAHARDMLDDELAARAAGRGLWGACEADGS
jgi:micrococcal nuclease